MKTYKLGNKTQCIIRSYCAGQIGSETMQYDNQPYTILKDAQLSLNFNDYDKSATKFNGKTLLNYSVDFLQSLTISDVELTDKILNLIFFKEEGKSCMAIQNCIAENNFIYINTSANQIYQVFIYNVDGELENAFGELTNFRVPVERDNEDYLVCFSYDGNKSFNLDRKQNIYLTLDFIITGNEDDETINSFIHIDKCVLSVDKNINFNRNLNSVDLQFQVINNGKSYITLN